MNYYNEHDPKAAAWLRELISAGLIPNGDVDERSITEVQPDELRQYTQCHFFAGIGGWSLALQLAGVPDTIRLWTGSCPCQPFSTAGKGLAQADERHLWPVFFNFIKECKPNAVFGEQVASAIGKGWLDGVQADLESENYACGATVLGAHSVSAPHIRQRLYWVADSDSGRCEQRDEGIGSVSVADQNGADNGLPDSGGWQRIIFSADCDEDGNCPKCGIDYADCECLGPTQDAVEYEEFDGVLYGRMGDTIKQGLERQSRYGDNGNKSRRFIENATGSTAEADHSNHWNNFTLANCRDGKSRRIPTEPAFQPLAHGIPARVVRLRGYGNAIVPQCAAEFIKAFLKSQTACSAVTAK